jgi:hypothetical protein
VCAAALGYVIVAKEIDQPRLVSLVSVPQYRFTRPARLTAKLIFPFSLYFSVTGIADLAPNRVLGRQNLVGFLCSDSQGVTLVGGTVSALDRLGRRVSLPTPLDDSGFFWVDLDPAGMAPVRLRFSSPTCSRDISLTDGIKGQSACSAHDSYPIRRPPEYTAWILSCK